MAAADPPPSEKKTYVGSSGPIATCLDCRWRFRGTWEECEEKLKEHREKTGHRG